VFREKTKNPKWFIKKITIAESPVHGLGVFASQPILKHEMFESCPVIIFHHSLTADYCQFYKATSHILDDYVFTWEGGCLAIAMGYGGIYNHSNNCSNAIFQMQTDDPRIEFIAKRNIGVGEEIFIHYRRGHRELDFDNSGSSYEPGKVPVGSSILSGMVVEPGRKM